MQWNMAVAGFGVIKKAMGSRQWGGLPLLVTAQVAMRRLAGLQRRGEKRKLVGNKPEGTASITEVTVLRSYWCLGCPGIAPGDDLPSSRWRRQLAVTVDRQPPSRSLARRWSIFDNISQYDSRFRQTTGAVFARPSRRREQQSPVMSLCSRSPTIMKPFRSARRSPMASPIRRRSFFRCASSGLERGYRSGWKLEAH